MKLSKKERDEKIVEWMGMSDDEKRVFNGWNGFCRGELFNDNNAFMIEDNNKLKLRLIKEKKFKNRQRKRENDKKRKTKNS